MHLSQSCAPFTIFCVSVLFEVKLLQVWPLGRICVRCLPHFQQLHIDGRFKPDTYRDVESGFARVWFLRYILLPISEEVCSGSGFCGVPCSSRIACRSHCRAASNLLIALALTTLADMPTSVSGRKPQPYSYEPLCFSFYLSATPALSRLCHIFPHMGTTTALQVVFLIRKLFCHPFRRRTWSSTWLPT